MIGQIEEQVGRGLARDDLHGVVVNDLDLRDRARVGAGPVIGLGVFDGGFDVLRRQRIAVVEGHALLEHERPLRVAVLRIAFRKIQLGLKRLHVDTGQAIIGQQVHLRAHQRVRIAGGEIIRFICQCYVQGIFLSCVGSIGVVSAARQQAGDHAERQRKSKKSLQLHFGVSFLILFLRLCALYTSPTVLCPIGLGNMIPSLQFF